MTQSVAGRSMSSGIVGSVLQTTRLFRKFQEIVAASSVSEASPAVLAAINRLTYDIARASARGDRSVTVMQLRENQNFRSQIWYKRLWYRKPGPEQLMADARAVFDYCQANGLNAAFTCYKYDREYSQLLSSMEISWDNQFLSAVVAERLTEKADPDSFCRALKTMMPNEKQRDLVARAKRSQALLLMPLVIRALDQAAKEGRTEEVVYKQSERSHFARELPGDIRDLCLMLGLKAEVVFVDVDCESYSKVLVSGWNEKQEYK